MQDFSIIQVTEQEPCRCTRSFLSTKVLEVSRMDCSKILKSMYAMFRADAGPKT